MLHSTTQDEIYPILLRSAMDPLLYISLQDEVFTYGSKIITIK